MPKSNIDLSSCYELLGLEVGCSAGEVRKARRRLGAKWHPDKFSDVKSVVQATAKMREINTACDALLTAIEGSSSARASARPPRNDARSPRWTTPEDDFGPSQPPGAQWDNWRPGWPPPRAPHATATKRRSAPVGAKVSLRTTFRAVLDYAKVGLSLAGLLASIFFWCGLAIYAGEKALLSNSMTAPAYRLFNRGRPYFDEWPPDVGVRTASPPRDVSAHAPTTLGTQLGQRMRNKRSGETWSWDGARWNLVQDTSQ